MLTNHIKERNIIDYEFIINGNIFSDFSNIVNSKGHIFIFLYIVTGISDTR